MFTPKKSKIGIKMSSSIKELRKYDNVVVIVGISRGIDVFVTICALFIIDIMPTEVPSEKNLNTKMPITK